jgi:hypothetical protein
VIGDFNVEMGEVVTDGYLRRSPTPTGTTVLVLFVVALIITTEDEPFSMSELTIAEPTGLVERALRKIPIQIPWISQK